MAKQHSSRKHKGTRPDSQKAKANSRWGTRIVAALGALGLAAASGAATPLVERVFKTAEPSRQEEKPGYRRPQSIQEGIAPSGTPPKNRYVITAWTREQTVQVEIEEYETSIGSLPSRFQPLGSVAYQPVPVPRWPDSGPEKPFGRDQQILTQAALETMCHATPTTLVDALEVQIRGAEGTTPLAYFLDKPLVSQWLKNTLEPQAPTGYLKDLSRIDIRPVESHTRPDDK